MLQEPEPMQTCKRNITKQTGCVRGAWHGALHVYKPRASRTLAADLLAGHMLRKLRCLFLGGGPNDKTAMGTAMSIHDGDDT